MTQAARAEPRYLQVADDLRARVLSGELTEGDKFPTEVSLCDTYKVSRFTVREALRRLEADNLIARRRGSGTTISPAGARGGTLHQPLSNVGEILQYARDTQITYDTLGLRPLPRLIAGKIDGGAPTGPWVLLRGVRRSADGKPIAATDAFIHGSLAGHVARLDPARYTLFRQLAEFADLRIGKVTQDIEAVAASQVIADALEVPRRSPCLRILRGYRDASGNLFEVSASHHPGNRFAYSMHIDVES